ncbi:hypothetical protein AQZ52_04500 [Novosphingobium fuchskuhlense]|uniref:Uncharacterized protein n=1 Tax=Novosphingobium fuchskuhlense TaxID=1117702 RepID=A0A117UX77_9SPHN|nr:hypothetical protein [Novosphingobium fuchskuhlense]KUR72509.1 hypothetical protein AQZ52_04500 [Novosphingobium fuchskuhlense]
MRENRSHLSNEARSAVTALAPFAGAILPALEGPLFVPIAALGGLTGGDYTIDHSAAVLMMSGKGHLADIIGHDDPDAAALAKLKALAG